MNELIMSHKTYECRKKNSQGYMKLNVLTIYSPQPLPSNVGNNVIRTSRQRTRLASYGYTEVRSLDSP